MVSRWRQCQSHRHPQPLLYRSAQVSPQVVLQPCHLQNTQPVAHNTNNTLFMGAIKLSIKVQKKVLLCLIQKHYLWAKMTKKYKALILITCASNPSKKHRVMFYVHSFANNFASRNDITRGRHPMKSCDNRCDGVCWCNSLVFYPYQGNLTLTCDLSRSSALGSLNEPYLVVPWYQV